VRVIAATNKNLLEMINTGTFRNDLYFRLNVISCRLPPLRERTEDIPMLVSYFLRLYCERYNKSIQGLSPELLARLAAHQWPGNIRELQNLINQEVLLCEENRIEAFRGSDLFTRIPAVRNTGSGSAQALPGTLKEASEIVLSEFERRFIASELDACGGNRTRCAEKLDITRKTLRLKMNKYGL
jgi:DNA-binding NtrC family response regulator